MSASITGTVNKKPLTPALQAKVQEALKGALKEEFTLPGIRPPHHLEITHINITFDKT